MLLVSVVFVTIAYGTVSQGPREQATSKHTCLAVVSGESQKTASYRRVRTLSAVHTQYVARDTPASEARYVYFTHSLMCSGSVSSRFSHVRSFSGCELRHLRRKIIAKVLLFAGEVDIIQTYVFWNLHAPREGDFIFEPGTRTDLLGFVRACQVRRQFCVISLMYACSFVPPTLK